MKGFTVEATNYWYVFSQKKKKIVYENRIFLIYIYIISKTLVEHIVAFRFSLFHSDYFGPSSPLRSIWVYLVQSFHFGSSGPLQFISVN